MILRYILLAGLFFGWQFFSDSVSNQTEEHTMEKITSKDGTTIGYRKSGSGPPLLLVHGTTADHRRWSAISPRFEKHFTVYAMDRRGRGESTDSPHYDIMREAEDIAAVLESIGEPAFVIGHSYGAACALETALLTDKISRLVLYEPPVPTGLPFYPPGAPEQMQTFIDRGELETALEIFFREVVKMPDQEFEIYRQLPMWKVRITLAPTIPRELAIDKSWNLNSRLFTGMSVPTLLLLGGDSPPLFQRAIEKVDSVLPNSKVVVMPHQQHVAIDTNPELFAEEVLRFLLE
jgi:pimeloyl-ACP methyl ester carboxylesterase